LEIEAETQTDEVAVEVYREDGYIRLGCLPKGTRAVKTFALPHADTGANGASLRDTGAMARVGEEVQDRQVELVVSAPVTAFESSLDYGGGGAKITAVRLLNHLEQESRVFEVGTSMQVVLEVEAYRELVNPVFVFCIYLADGQCLSQWLVTSEQLGKRSIQGRCRVTFDVSNLVMGRASCVGSAAIFKYLRPDGYEAESYHVLDRCIHFQIIQRMEDAIERGLCMQPFEATITSIL
jgi:lipopolysaccharide transport system ATP-binding protein